MKKIFAMLSMSAIFVSGCQTSPTTEYVEIQRPEPKAEPLSIIAPVINLDTKYAQSGKFSEPWESVEFSRSELVSTSLDKAFESFEQRKESFDYSKVEVYIQDTIPPEHAAWIKRLAEDTILMFSDEIDQPIHIIVGSGTGFMQEVVNQNGLAMPMIAEEVCYYSYGACSQGNTVWVGAGSRGLSVLDKRYDFSRMLSHKSLHAFQDQIDWASGGQTPPRSMDNFRPVWFVEGFAEFYGFAMNDYHGLHDYEKSQNEWFGYAPLRELEEWNDHSEIKYLWGQVAIEYIVANAGYEKLIQIYVNLNSGDDFETAFKNALGISLEDFYNKFDQWAKTYQS